MAENNIQEILEETKQHFDKKTEETKRHFDVVAEDLKGEIKQVAEGVSLNTEKINLLQKDMTGVKEGIEVIKVDIAFIKNDLKQKIGRDEFAILEKRVSMLEAKVSQA